MSSLIGNTNTTAQWYYFLQNDPRGKPDGWYPYDASLNNTVESFYQMCATTASAHPTSGKVQLPTISGFVYEIDFHRMTQRNMTSGKCRPMARTTNGTVPTHVPSSTARRTTTTTTPSFNCSAVTQAAMASASPAFNFGGISTAPNALFGSTAPVTAATGTPSTASTSHRRRGTSNDTCTNAKRTRSSVHFASKIGDRNTLQYHAPETLHKLSHVDESKAFCDVPQPLLQNPEEKKQDEDDGDKKGGEPEPECAICLDSLFNTAGDRVVMLKGCSHKFHYSCIHDSLTKLGAKCPLCLQHVKQDDDDDGTTSTPLGLSPSGSMVTSIQQHSCRGYEPSRTFQIIYNLPSGKQKSYHPFPGTRYSGANRTAYLPDTPEGRNLIARLQYSFCHGLNFMVGTSLTTHQPNVVTWASIHHKTSMNGGTYGYPDDDYFDRCNDELNSKGVPAADQCVKWLDKL